MFEEQDPVTEGAADPSGLALDGLTLSVDRGEVLALLRLSGRAIVEVDERQIRNFAGNVLQVSGTTGPLLAMSTTAHASLRPEQLQALQAHGEIMAVDVSTVEAAGGSVRCMLAGIHLPQ